jgi:hypothetical protein
MEDELRCIGIRPAKSEGGDFTRILSKEIRLTATVSCALDITETGDCRYALEMTAVGCRGSGSGDSLLRGCLLRLAEVDRAGTARSIAAAGEQDRAADSGRDEGAEPASRKGIAKARWDHGLGPAGLRSQAVK